MAEAAQDTGWEEREAERDAFLKDCKARAQAFLDKGDLVQAAVSMVTDLRQREDTAPSGWLIEYARSCIADWDAMELRRWIQGFR